MTKSILGIVSLSFLLSLLLMFSLQAKADCGIDYQICSKTCAVKHLTDEGSGAEAACKTKCVGSRGVCLAKEGADKTTEVSKNAWQNTKAFFGELTKE